MRFVPWWPGRRHNHLRKYSHVFLDVAASEPEDELFSISIFSHVDFEQKHLLVLI